MLKINGASRPDVALQRMGWTTNPMACLEIKGASAWIIASNGYVMVRLPVEMVDGASPDVAGPLGPQVFDILRTLAMRRPRSWYMQCDVDSVEFYDEYRQPVSRRPRGTHPAQWTERIRTMQNPTWDYPLVVGVKIPQLAAAARAMGADKVVYLHMKPTDHGTVSEAMRVSEAPYSPDEKPHGYVSAIPVPAGVIKTTLDAQVCTPSQRARLEEAHPWMVRPVEPVRPVT